LVRRPGIGFGGVKIAHCSAQAVSRVSVLARYVSSIERASELNELRRKRLRGVLAREFHRAIGKDEISGLSQYYLRFCRKI